MITDLYRAVSPGEFHDLMTTRRLNVAPNTYEGKQFGLVFQETLHFADLPFNRSAGYAAIVKISIPTAIYQQLKTLPHNVQVDTMIFRGGTLTVDLAGLALINQNLLGIEHVL
ncbi:MAG: hypothetical protein MUC97_15665 [Bernardetiaceae bacterium]|jgi:hypothetical protein|nr:hypothetical protein [Bernardetiaceae bacterium]